MGDKALGDTTALPYTTARSGACTAHQAAGQTYKRQADHSLRFVHSNIRAALYPGHKPVSKQKATCKGNSASHLIHGYRWYLWQCLVVEHMTTEAEERASVPCKEHPLSLQCSAVHPTAPQEGGMQHVFNTSSGY